MKKVGLTLGKFAPLHKGHEHLLKTMLDEMDEGIVLVYDTHVTHVPLHIRAGWIRKLFPEITVIEARGSPAVCPDIHEYERREERYITALLRGRDITAFYSSEYYGEHMSKALGCIDRRMDRRRDSYRISGTMIRDDPFRYREYISDTVYPDLIIKVVFLGSVSTGKSTIAEALAKKYGTTYVSEYGREYWEFHQQDRRLSIEAFDEIALGHIEREEEAFLSANRYCFIDTNAITTYMFALDYHGRAPELLTRLALENTSRYDLFFLCGDDIPYDDTWDRSGDQKRRVFQKQTISDLNARRIPYIILEGDLETRIKRVDEVLNEYQPYSNIIGGL